MSGDPETENIFICWAQLSGFHQDGDRIKSPKRRVYVKCRTMGIIRNCDSYVNVPSSQTYKKNSMV
jgi:hypothetical protein